MTTATAVKPRSKKAGPLQRNPGPFQKIGNDAVTDVRTGLSWSHTLGQATHAKAQELVDQLNAKTHAGFADWRLPTVEELFCLADRSKFRPAIDSVFADTKSDFYWSSSAYAPDPAGCAWGVFFGFGSSGDDYRDGDGFVRAVRGPVARPGQ